MLRNLSAAILAIAAGNAADPRPNVIVVLVDDLGYAALSCNGGSLVRTPNLDRLAGEGLRFTNCHVQPLCSPTRVGLMTGRGNRRNYTGFGDFDTREPNFARLLQGSGYATAVVGKWQLGSKGGIGDAGFATSHIRNYDNAGRPNWSRYWGGTVDVDGVRQEVPDDVFAADLQLEWSLRWIDAQGEKPFLIYLPTPLVHSHFVNGPPEYTAGRPMPGIEKVVGMRSFPSLLGHLDRQMGVLTDHLRTRGLDRRTLVLFLGDNGTGMRIPQADGRVEPPGKGKTSNPGTHSPCIAWWPGTVQPGVASDLVSELDILPTVAELAKVPLPAGVEFDGVSLARRLVAGEPSPRQSIYHWYSPHGEPPVVWAHDARWKLYADGRFFDTIADREERSTIAEPPTEAIAARERLQAVIDRQAAIPEPKNLRKSKIDDDAGE